MLAHVGLGRLEGIVPVAMTVGREAGSGNDPALDQVQGALDMLPHGGLFGGGIAVGVEERQGFIQQPRIAGGGEILGQGQNGPIDDVSVGISRPDVALAVEEHEPLRPVTIGILLPEDPAQEITDGFEAAERQQQLHRPLADIAGAPAAAGVLFQAAR